MGPATLTKAYVAISIRKCICFFGLTVTSVKDSAKVNNSQYY